MEILVIPVGYLQENSYIAYDEDKVAVVIDPGDEGQKLVEAIRDRGLDVRYILLTHGHFDHTGAVMEIKNEFGAAIRVSCLLKTGGAAMQNSREEDLLISIQNTASEVADEYGDDVVKSVLRRYNAASIEDLSPSDYEEVFGELYQIATDN